MSKRNKKEKNRAFNTHHLCWPRKRWDRGYARLLRYHWYFIVEIPADTLHREIHARIEGIPVPDGRAAKSAYEQVVLLDERGALHQGDTVENRLNLLAALFDCIEQPTADAFREQMFLVHRFNKKAPP